MSAVPAGRRWVQALRGAGMSCVLALLCAAFSILTLRDEALTGDDAAADAARRAEAAGAGKPVLIVSRETDDGRAFAAAVARRLPTARQAVGGPGELKRALRQIAAAGGGLGAVVTTSDNLVWTPLKDLSDVGNPPVIAPGVRRWPVFLTRQNLLNVANQIVVVAILAAGLTFVILTGGVDLSVGSLVALAAVVAARLVRDHLGGAAATPAGLAAAAAAAVALCGLVGAGSGAVVVLFNVPSFIATLAVMQAAGGLAFILSHGESLYDLPESAAALGRGTGVFGIPHAVAVMAAVYGASHLLLSRTVLGRSLYAVGGNETAARFSGVATGRVKLFAFAASGALAGLGGIILTSQLKSAAPTYGLNYELYAIASVVVGGASLNGGRGGVFGTLVGALIIAVLQNGMNLTNIESYSQKLVLGLVILGAVLLDHIGKARSR